MKKSYIWFSYILIVALLLVVIVFILPDKFFLKSNKANNSSEIDDIFKDYKIMIEELKDSNYNYKFTILLGDKEYIYEGSKNEDGFIGNFNDGQTITEYSELNSYINKDIIDLDNLFNILKNEKYEESVYNKTRMFSYNINVNGLYTEVIIYTDLYNINKITVANKEYQYFLVYS